MPLQATSGAASYDAFGGGVPVVPNYIEDVFSTYLYKGNSSTQTITNGIDLSGKGGLTWIKVRDFTYNHYLYDTARGVSDALFSNSTSAQSSSSNFSSFDSSGFTLNSSGGLNNSSYTYASWTFRKQPKFFDVVTYTGNGVSGRAISHNLGSTPGFIVVKCTSTAAQWICWHRAYNSGNGYGYLNDTTDWFNTGADVWGNGTTYTAPTSTTFTVNGNTVGNLTNGTGNTYVAYIFAHNAGGFGLTGTDNVISCGSYTGTGAAGNTVTLGYEPQWVLIKEASGSGNSWILVDNMRGMPVGSNDASLFANTSAAENSSQDYLTPTATGFILGATASGVNDSGFTYIYIAIRRGPMKVPTSGTSVFAPTIGVAATPTFIGNFPVDFCIAGAKGGTDKWWQSDRLRGPQRLNSATADAESSAAYVSFDNMTGCFTDSFSNYLGYVFRRAPSFMDVVCYTGTGSATTFSHNLGVVPELIITKVRAGGPPDFGWAVYASPLGATKALFLDTTDAEQTLGAYWNNTAPTSSVFTVGNANKTNRTSYTYVAYIFATCAGVSKVGSYTGNGSSQTINCGFTGGARFVMVKATSTTGNWIVADSARGIVAGNDPALYLNSTAAEVTGLDWIDADNSGFVVNETATIAANTNGVSYIFFAVA